MACVPRQEPGNEKHEKLLEGVAIIGVFEEGFGEGLFAKSLSPTTLPEPPKFCDRFQ